MKNIAEKYSVSRETIEHLKAYEASLREWQNKFNLVSSASLEDSWNRHFLDSMQLFRYIPQDVQTLYDFGSGAGFPGMVLAIMAKEKTPYLKHVAEMTGANVEVLNERIENLPRQKVDVITSRAMTALDGLLGYAFPFCGKKTLCIFPKGKKYAEEIAEARKHWKFDCQAMPSEYSDEGVILLINNLSKLKGVK